MKNSPVPVINLIGDPEENFYQLGLKDRADYSIVLNHTKSLISTPWQPLNRAFEEVAKVGIKALLTTSKEFKKNISAYSEGLGISVEEVAFAMVVPELVSCMSKWVPGVKHTTFGCSSYFLWDEKLNAPVHGRVLDFPLLSTFDDKERVLCFNFKNSPRIFSFGTSGFPYPSITSMTDNGVTFAIHQKFTNVFDSKGTPIFQIVYDMLNNAGDMKSAIEFLKSSRSMTTWACYMSFENGDVLAADIMGEELHYNSYKIGPNGKNDIVYLCNKLENPNLKQSDFLPFGVESYNNMRSEVANKKIEQLKKKGLNDIELLKSMGSTINQKTKKVNNWNCDTLTMSSLQVCTLCPKENRALFIPEEGPKHYQDYYLEFSNCFENTDQVIKKSKGPRFDPDYKSGMREYMLAQVAFDADDIHGAYHHLQMGISYLEEYPEATIGRFFFLVFQYMHEKNERDRFHLLKEFKEMRDKLPEYLNDHCLLFIARMEKANQDRISISVDEIQNEHLKRTFEFEMKIHRWFLHKTTATLMNPRLDILDIIYTHVHTR